MLELTYIGTPQTVAVNEAVIYNTHTVKTCKACEKWRNGTGRVKLLGSGRYVVTFSANVTIPTGIDPADVILAITQGGDSISGAIMRTTPAVADRYYNVAVQTYVDVVCCDSISVENIGTTNIIVDNPNLTVARVRG